MVYEDTQAADFRRMIEAARNAMVHVLDLNKRDALLVVTDQATRRVGEAFEAAGRRSGCTAELYCLPSKDRPLKTAPAPLLAALAGKSVVINAFQAIREETPFRVEWVRGVNERDGVRMGHCPGITEAMMIKGPMNVDYPAMLDEARRMMAAFENARHARITAPGGTALDVGIEDRGFKTDVKITEHNGGNLPCGEIWCGPAEDGCSGVLVVDGSIGDLGNVTRPLRLFLEAGRVARVESDDADLAAEVDRLLSVDDEARVIGELGIGVNPGAKLTGNLLEDEKALGTAHIAFGNNEDMPGGRNRSKTHRDFLFNRPTFEVTYKDGSTRVVIREGEFGC